MNSTLIIYIYWIYFSVILLFYKGIKDYSFSFFLLILSSFVLLSTYQGLHSDWVSYREFYSKATKLGMTYFEKGFDYLLYVANKIGSFEIVPIFTLLTFILLFIEIYKYTEISKNQFFILLVSFYFSFLPLYFGALRQACSSNFIYICLFLYRRKKYVRSGISALLSFLFHHSAILIFAIIFTYFIYCLLLRKKSKKKFIFYTLLVVVGMYLVFKVTVESLFVALDMVYRLGNADNFTSNPIKDLFILAERFVFIYFCFYLMQRKRNFNDFIINLSLGGNFFYCIFYSLARNLSGRTLAFFRYLDIYIMYEALITLVPKILYLTNKKSVSSNNRNISNISLLLCIFYSLIKYYVTVASSGVF